MGGERGLEVEHGVGLDKGVVDHVIDPLAIELGTKSRVDRLETYGEVETEDLAMVIGCIAMAGGEAYKQKHYKQWGNVMNKRPAAH